MSDSSSRREFLQQAATATAAISAGIQLSTTLPRLSAAESPAVYESPELAALRRKAARRRRRLIYNDDGCGPIMQPGGDSPQGFLDGANSRMRVLPGTQVDSVFICSGATHVLNHPTKVAESYADVADKYQIGGEWALMRDNMRALEKAGTDAVQLTIDFCRRRRLEVVYSHRINDIHNQFLAVERSTWFREHPQYWLNTPENASQAGGVNSPRHWWSALDFERPEVLAHLAGIQEEVCGRYDIDGIEIDYFRSPMFFRPNLDFDPATPDQREILTGFQRRLRELHFRTGTKRNRPILTIARVPATVERCLHVGIDIERWMQERLVDLLTIGGGYIPFTEPLEELVASAHRADIPVYATISASGMRGPENRYSAHEAWRGAAANLWKAGVDGIVTFNIFPTNSEPRFTDIGSPESLAGKDKLFVVDPIRILEGDLVQGIEQSQALPQPIPGDGQPGKCELPVGDDLPFADKQGTLAKVELRIHLSDPRAVDLVETRLNGTVQELADKSADGWMTFYPRGAQFRQRRNELSFHARQAKANSGKLADVLHVELSVIYKQ